VVDSLRVAVRAASPLPIRIAQNGAQRRNPSASDWGAHRECDILCPEICLAHIDDHCAAFYSYDTKRPQGGVPERAALGFIFPFEAYVEQPDKIGRRLENCRLPLSLSRKLYN